MRRLNEKGLTLVELLVTITIMGIIAVAAMPLLSTCLEAHGKGIARSELYQEGLLAMERMTSGVRRCTFLLIPNAHDTTRDILAFSGFINDDDDYYFNDSLFPKIDEDLKGEMTIDDLPGIGMVDDDGDGLVDESADHSDDDEDGLLGEDPLNGEDDDGDGNIDEDVNHDSNDDGAQGIAKIDDNGDGQVDNGATSSDDDEDGVQNEDSLNPVMYTFESGTNTLTESLPSTGESVDLSSHVSQFQVTYEAPDVTHGPRVQIALTITGDDAESVQFVEYACPRNTLQKTGKRVR
ncbi:MAG: type II secretion system protein [Desulfobacterales bacterium]|jgi:prepilin-type N-terminal cleavage/methylation domain-containing protein